MKTDRLDKRVERIYYARCSGAVINIMDIGKVFAVGRKAIEAGGDDQAVGDAIAAFVDTIKA